MTGHAQHPQYVPARPRITRPLVCIEWNTHRSFRQLTTEEINYLHVAA